MTIQEKALEILRRLEADNPHPKIELDYSTPFELLVATMLSAQATDKKVNQLTPALFAKYKTISDYANESPEEIDTYVRQVLFHNNKSKNIVASAKKIMEKFNGNVPGTMAQLLTLPGVARKTANVILGNIFNKAEGIVIDTHGIRLAQRFGLTLEKTPEKIERDLMVIIPKEKWIIFGQLLTLHGRHVCVARPHKCENCPLGNLCPEHTLNS